MKDSTALIIFLFPIVIFIIYCLRIINPKLDWNYETEEKILWYNDPFDHCIRKTIVVYKKKT